MNRGTKEDNQRKEIMGGWREEIDESLGMEKKMSRQKDKEKREKDNGGLKKSESLEILRKKEESGMIKR